MPESRGPLVPRVRARGASYFFVVEAGATGAALFGATGVAVLEAVVFLCRWCFFLPWSVFEALGVVAVLPVAGLVSLLV